MSRDLKYWIWLSTLSRISPGKRKQLFDFFGDPEEIWNTSHDNYRNVPFMTAAIYEQLTDQNLRSSVEKHIDNICRLGISVLTISDEEYPQYLKNIYDPPTVLYVKGKIKSDHIYIAVVGSRKATAYGLNMAESLSHELSRAGFTVVSGMARGIDTYAHKGALKFKGSTVAVLGCGLDIVYPPENRNLMGEIISSGCVISEYLPGTQPRAYNFPARNRIISGLARGVVVIEAGESSGSLITANFALEQGRDVFAVPGNANSVNSRGTNKLIKDGAKMVTGIDDILEEIRIFSDVENSNIGKCNKNMISMNGLDTEERIVMELLLTEPLNIDMISRRSELSINTVNSVLVMLELKGLIEQFPGKVFMAKNNF